MFSYRIQLAQCRSPLTISTFCFSGGLFMQHQIDTAYPLYNAHWEHDACGTGFLAQISGEPSHQLVQTALEALTRLTHRGAQDADAETSDGAGLLTQITRAIFCVEIQALGIHINDTEYIVLGMI